MFLLFSRDSPDYLIATAKRILANEHVRRAAILVLHNKRGEVFVDHVLFVSNASIQ